MRPLPSLSSPSLPCLWTRPSLTSNRSAKSASTTISTEQIRGLFAEVLDLEVFAHPAADVAAPEHHEVRVGPPTRRMAAEHEHRAERVGRGGRERLGRGPVEREPELGHETRVAEEQALRVVGIDLARTARDAERRAFDERDDAVGSSHARARARRPRLGHCATVAGRQTSSLPLRRTACTRRVTLREMRIAVVAPVWFPVPPTGYGGIELVVSLLADGLVDAGHDVTLFASGGSRTKATLVSPMPEPPAPRRPRQPLVRRVPRARVVPPGRRVRRRAPTTPASSVRSAARCCGTTRRWCTPCTGRGPSRTASSTRSSPATCISSRSATRSARPTSTFRTRAPCTTASTSRTTSTTRTRNAVSSTSVAPTPTRGRRKRSRSRAAPGFRCT